MKGVRGGMQSALRAAAFAAAAAGIACTLWAARAVPGRLRVIERKEAELRVLAELERQSRAIDPYFAVLATVTSAPPETPAAIVRRLAQGGPAPVVTAGPAEPVEGGWSLRKFEVTLTDVPIDSLSAMIVACETSHPPWRPSQVRIQAIDPGSTRARAALTLEGIERAAPGDRP